MNKAQLRDMPTKHDGEGYVTVNGEVLVGFKIAKLSIKTETVSTQKRFLNERVEQNAARGLKISGSLSFYACTKAFIQAVENFKNGGEYPDISIQGWAKVNNKERTEILVTGVILSSQTMIDLDDSADDEVVSECDMTANDFQVIE